MSEAQVPPLVVPKKDMQTARPDGTRVGPVIHDVVIRRLNPIEDERGEINEIYRSEWGVHDKPLVYAYQTMVRPGKFKGWVLHQKQDDRLYHMLGTLQWALFDERPDSPSHGTVQTFVVSERSRALFVIPQGVWHAVKNIGLTDAYFINLPTRAYSHEDPDKYRLPLPNERIPFAFDDKPGW
jgi:dTDP-4-dehydrorhamnose 3,5-epimerase